MVEQLMLRNKIKVNSFIRFGYRTVYVLLTTFVAISLVRGQRPAVLRNLQLYRCSLNSG